MQSQTASPRLLRVFLCHSSGDKPAVHELYRRLKACNIDPWLDKENLLPGQDWEYEIRKVVKHTDAVIACLSRESISKTGFVQKEIKLALDVYDEQPEGSIFLIPLKLEECDLTQRLKPFHAVNYFEEDGFDKLISALKYRGESLGGKVAVLYMRSDNGSLFDMRQQPTTQQDQLIPSDQKDSIAVSPQVEETHQHAVSSETDEWNAETAINRLRPLSTSQRGRKHNRLVLSVILLMLVLAVVGIGFILHIAFPLHFTPIKPGGAWISPNGTTVGDVIHFAAYAFPTNIGDPEIDHVSFTAYWQGVDPRKWVIACVARKPSGKDIFACDANIHKLGAHAGQIKISFEVYDRQGNVNSATNGEHILIYSPGS